MSYTHLNADDPAVEVFRGVFLKMRRGLGTTGFGINEIRLAPGAAGAEHDESDTGQEEVYAILEGSGTFTIDGTAVGVVAGDYLRVDPGTMRVPVAGDDGLRFIAVGAKPQPEYDGRQSL